MIPDLSKKKTITNRSKRSRTLARCIITDLGNYEYFFLTPAGTRRYQIVTTAHGTSDNKRSLFAKMVRAKKLDGRFSFRETIVDADPWRHVLGPGESVRVPVFAWPDLFSRWAGTTGANNPLARGTASMPRISDTRSQPPGASEGSN